jgi:hypothetical protein
MQMAVECALKVGAMCHFAFSFLIIIVNKSECHCEKIMEQSMEAALLQ